MPLLSFIKRMGFKLSQGTRLRVRRAARGEAVLPTAALEKPNRMSWPVLARAR
jgi:hypothetical protein